MMIKGARRSGSLVLVLGLAAVGCVGSSNNAGPDGGPSLDGGPGNDAAPPDTDAGTDAGADAPPPPVCPTITGPGTTHNGTAITTDTTWTAATSPHVITADMAVKTGATLTLEPCAVVQITGAYGITVTGKIAAPGTPANPISITGTDPQKPFTTIQAVNGGTLDFANVTLKNGGNTSDTFYPAPIFLRGDGVTVQPLFRAVNVTIDGSQTWGVYMVSGLFSPDSTGLTIKNAARGPIRASAPLAGSIPAGSYTGNGVDELLMVADATLTGTMTLHDRGVPYRIGDEQGNGMQFRLGANATATAPDQPGTLVVDPGVTIRMSKTGRILMSAATGTTASAIGTLVANGTAAKPVVFTSDAPAPAAGDWLGLYFAGIPSPTNHLDYVHVEYAGGPSGAISFHCSPTGTLDEGEDSAILILGGPPATEFITNSTITSSAGYGIDRGWRGAPLDFTATNTFTNVAKCVQSYPRDINGLCPTPVPCP